MFGNVSGDQCSIPSQVIPKTQKMVLDASLFNTQYYKVWIKSKWSPPLHLNVVATEKGAFRLPSNTVGQLTLLTYIPLLARPSDALHYTFPFHS